MIVPSGSSVISCPFSALQHAVPLARAALVKHAAQGLVERLSG